MSDPDRDSDTEPTGRRLANGDGPDAHADEATEPNPPSCADTAERSGENDTDDFMRWLPTLALGHRRRTEIVERPSSDGADFAVYACKGRPAATSGQARIESAVNVQAARGSKDLQRDAPTVLTGQRRARRWWRSIGWAALGAGAAGTVLSAWAWRPATPEKALRRDEAASTPAPIRSTRPPLTAPGPPSAAADREAASQGSSAEVATTATDRRSVVASAPAAEGVRKKGSAGVGKTIASSAGGRGAPLAAAPTVPAKDQYFEAP